MAEVQKESKHHLDKTTNTIILDYLLWLSAKTILSEVSSPSEDSTSRSKGRRLVGLVDGVILTFDMTNRPKFSYTLLTRRLGIASLVILFCYRDSRARYITRRSSENVRPTEGKRRTAAYLRERHVTSVLRTEAQTSRFDSLEVSDSTVQEARKLFGLVEGDEAAAEPRYRMPSLIDAMEEFISVSASTYAHSGASPAKVWIRMATTFSLFAALEAFLVNQETGADALNQCFSFDAIAEPESGNAAVDRLFKIQGNKDFKEFESVWNMERNKCLVRLTGPSNTSSSLEEHLLALLRELDWAAFRLTVCDYLTAIMESMDAPELCKYSHSGILDRSLLRAPGMISIEHEETDSRNVKRTKVST